MLQQLVCYTNKMIQGMDHFNQEYQYFANPEIIQEIRQNLTPFANCDQREHQEMVSALNQKVRLFLSQSLDVVQEQAQGLCVGVWEIIQSGLFEHRQKSANLASVAALSIKMIDFITEQSATYYHSIEEYQLQVDRLQNIIHDLNNKNNIIETDVQIFKEQLEAARNQLDQITEQKQEHAQQLGSNEDMLRSMRQSKIETLECQLQRMRAQLSYYKASGLSRGSLKCEQMGLKNMMQTKSLLYLNQKDNGKLNPHILGRSQCEEDNLAKYSQKNKELEEENQKLRMEINNYRNRCSLQSLPIQQKMIERSKSLARVKTAKNMNEKSSTSFFDFAQFFTLLKGKHQQKIENICQEREAQLSQLQTQRQHQQKEVEVYDENIRHLSSQWSKGSLKEYNVPQLDYPPQLIYLTQQSQGIQNGQAYNEFFFDCSPTKITEYKLTQTSSSCNHASYQSVGINTVREQAQVIQTKTTKQTWISRVLKGIVCNSYVDRIKEMVVTKRIKQKASVVNRGALQVSK